MLFFHRFYISMMNKLQQAFRLMLIQKLNFTHEERLVSILLSIFFVDVINYVSVTSIVLSSNFS